MPDTDLDNVRPVSPRFFGAVLKDPGLSLSAKDALVNEALSGRVKLEEVRSNLVRSQQQERLGELRIEREEFMLSRAREQAHQDKVAVAKAGELSGTFTALLDDPSLTPGQKRDTMARIRLQNPEAFARNPSLRDQFTTLEGVLPKEQRAPSISEQIAIKNLERGLRKDQIEDLRRIQGEKQDTADRTFEAFDEEFKRIEGARFKKPENSFDTDSKFDDEFENPEDRETTIGFLESYAPFVGIEIPNETLLKQMGANELRRRAGEVNRKLRPRLLEERGARSSGTKSVSSLNIPSRL